ncbi:MAG: class I SAM-dependent methyltransferase [Proteobacteria bacterium]|nr:class I SAM-dependent methyltransferase [Pseudomonadota bacterium]
MNYIKSFYDEFSNFYNDTIPLKEKDNADKRIEIFEKLFSNRYGNDKNQIKILDLGCGTGEYVVDLAKAGYDVTGIDFSKGMLSMCEDNAKEQGVSAELICERGQGQT